MKIIKKITAIMLSIMMVLGMCSVVGADTSASASGRIDETLGTINITNAKKDETYKVYRLLNLDSYYYTTNDKEGNYSYTFRTEPENKWKDFFEQNATAKKYFEIVDGKYVTVKEEGKDKGEEIAREALNYATENGISFDAEQIANSDGTLSFSSLKLGYYLVKSTVGSLCSLDTTNPVQEIKDKNEEPTIVKNVYNENDEQAKSNTAYIGARIQFEIFINVKKGAENYVLHDELENGLKLDETTTELQPTPVFLYDDIAGEMKSGVDYIYEKTTKGFNVTLTEQYLKKNKDKGAYTVHVGYYAILTENATIGPVGNKNKAWLSYGTSQETKPEETITRTYGFAVLKFYKDADGREQGLANAQFKLYTDAACSDDKIVKLKGNGNNRYIVDKSSTDNILTSPENGEFVIQGLQAGTYYLKEIEAPKGYNLLAKPIEVNLSTDTNGSGQITIYQDNAKVNKIKVENKSGSLLPSTGGMGTTVFYIAGALLVLISGIVLIAKKRTDSK